MRCDCCPLYSSEDTCPEADGEYGIEHKDGVCGCRHPWNWVHKRDMMYADALGEIMKNQKAYAHWIFKRRRPGGWRRMKCIDAKTGEPVEVFIDEREDDMEPFCSACGTHNEGDIDTCMNYCPHCGAKMLGDAREEYWQAYLAVINE